jgi:hypothetical protein
VADGDSYAVTSGCDIGSQTFGAMRDASVREHFRMEVSSSARIGYDGQGPNPVLFFEISAKDELHAIRTR